MSLRKRTISVSSGTETTLIKKGPGEYGGAVMLVGNFTGLMYVRDCGDVDDFGLSNIIDVLEIEPDAQGRSSQRSAFNNKLLFTDGLTVSVGRSAGAAGSVNVVIKYK